MYPDPDIHLFDEILDTDMFTLDSDLSLNMDLLLIPGFPDRMGLDPVPYTGQENVSWIVKEKEK